MTITIDKPETTTETPDFYITDGVYEWRWEDAGRLGWRWHDTRNGQAAPGSSTWTTEQLLENEWMSDHADSIRKVSLVPEPPKPVITAEDALEVLALAVARKGAGFRYFDAYEPVSYGPVCSNVVDGKGACIVGTGLAERGYAIEALDIVGGCMATQDALRIHYGSEQMNNEARSVLVAAQVAQDNRASWGEALAEAGAKALEIIRARVTD